MQRSLKLAGVLCVLMLSQTLAAASEDGFKPIFDGKSLDGWDGNPKFWHVEDGVITGETTAENPASGNTFLIWRGGKPADFELKAEFRMPNPGFANSGIQYRSREEPEQWGKWVVAATRPTWTAATSTPGSSTKSVAGASSPSAARRSRSAQTTSRKWSRRSARRPS